MDEQRQNEMYDAVMATRSSVDALKPTVKRLDHIVTGGEKPDDGLVLKVDRLETAETTRKKLTMAAVLAAIGAFVAAVAKWFMPG